MSNTDKQLMTPISVMIMLFIKSYPFSIVFIPFNTTQVFRILLKKLTVTLKFAKKNWKSILKKF